MDDLRLKRLKIARVDDMNDPFEMHSVHLPTAEHRRVWRIFVRDAAQHSGALCFSAAWRNPVLWSHYADRHRGICLGFDIPDKYLMRVRYRRTRLRLQVQLDQPSGGLTENDMLEILLTKFIGWKYENEVRTAPRLQRKDQATGLYFKDFDHETKLTEVIVGFRSDLSLPQVRDAIGPSSMDVKITKARLAFRSFDIIS
jgi:hypothetical protein